MSCLVMVCSIRVTKYLRDFEKDKKLVNVLKVSFILQIHGNGSSQWNF